MAKREINWIKAVAYIGIAVGAAMIVASYIGTAIELGDGIGGKIRFWDALWASIIAFFVYTFGFVKLDNGTIKVMTGLLYGGAAIIIFCLFIVAVDWTWLKNKFADRAERKEIEKQGKWAAEVMQEIEALRGQKKEGAGVVEVVQEEPQEKVIKKRTKKKVEDDDKNVQG